MRTLFDNVCFAPTTPPDVTTNQYGKGQKCKCKNAKKLEGSSKHTKKHTLSHLACYFCVSRVWNNILYRSLLLVVCVEFDTSDLHTAACTHFKQPTCAAVCDPSTTRVVSEWHDLE